MDRARYGSRRHPGEAERIEPGTGIDRDRDRIQLRLKIR